MIRLFVALEIPPEIKQEISNLRRLVIGETTEFKWETEDKIHLTLKFIGNVKQELLISICESLEFLNEIKKIDCKLTRFGFFFKHKMPQILWIGLWVNSILFNIVEQLNNDLVKFNIPVEDRKFKPHLTLLRIKKSFPEEWGTKFINFSVPEINFKSEYILLIKSELLPGSSRYTIIKKFKLK
jgi:RNA 2',3'-cyclic 3'-phosphodiesterase